MNFNQNEDRNIKIPIMIFFMIILFISLMTSIPLKMLFNLNAFIIIFAGILISVFISFPMDVLRNTIIAIRYSFSDDIDYERTINKVYQLSVKVKKDGLLSIGQDIDYEENTFLRDGMILLNDYKKEDAIEDIMDHDIQSRYVELMKPYNVMKMVANIAPAFGLIGTLVGMIGLLTKINIPAEIMGNMASALVSTLYGSLVANFLAFPAMARIKEYNDNKLLECRMIKEGILLIAGGDSTRNVFDKMNVMLKEDKRVEYPKDYRKAESGEDYGFEEFIWWW